MKFAFPFNLKQSLIMAVTFAVTLIVIISLTVSAFKYKQNHAINGKTVRVASGKNQPVVLLYHHISNIPFSNSTIPPELFAAHMEALEREGYRFITLNDLGNHLSGKKILTGKTVAVTFDDGYMSFYKHAFPILKEKRIPAANFIIVGTIRNINPANNGLAKLSWPQIREMRQHNICFYPHSFNSHYMASDGRRARPLLSGPILLTGEDGKETVKEYESRVERDLSMAKTILEVQTGHKATHLAWPFGEASPQAVKIAEKLGYEYFYYMGYNSQGYKPELPCNHIARLNAGNPDITPETLIKLIKKYALLSSLDSHDIKELDPVPEQPSPVPIKASPKNLDGPPAR